MWRTAIPAFCTRSTALKCLLAQLSTTKRCSMVQHCVATRQGCTSKWHAAYAQPGLACGPACRPSRHVLPVATGICWNWWDRAQSSTMGGSFTALLSRSRRRVKLQMPVGTSTRGMHACLFFSVAERAQGVDKSRTPCLCQAVHIGSYWQVTSTADQATMVNALAAFTPGQSCGHGSTCYDLPFGH